MTAIRLAFLFLALAVPAAAQAPAPAASQDAVEAAVADVVQPGYQALADGADAQAALIGDLCREPGAERLDAARAGFRDLVLAWSGVEPFRFGPAREENRYERLFFWPDPRGRGLQQVQAILAGKDEAATDAGTLRGKSVAVQGLLALEFVLFGTGSDVLAIAGDPDRAFRCRYGAAIAAAIAATADEILARWSGDDGYGALMRAAGPENAVYRSPGEAIQELLKAAREQLQLDRDAKLARSIGADPGEAQPRLAPFWRSDLAAAAVAANLGVVRRLAGPDGIAAALPEAWIGRQLAFDLDQARGVLVSVDGSDQPWENSVSDPEMHAGLTYALIPLADAVALLENDYPQALGLITGFNSLDGD